MVLLDAASPCISPHGAGNSNESVNLGARFSKHGLLGTLLVVRSPALLAQSCVARQEQRHASVPACAEVGEGGRSWQRCPAWQGSCGPDLSGLKNRTGTRRTFVFSLGAGTGPSGCSQDVMASRLSRGGGPHHAPTPWTQQVALLHPCSVPILSDSRARSSARPARLAGGAPQGHQRDEQPWQRDSLQLETPLPLTTAHVPSEPRGGQGVCATGWCKT